MTHTIVASTVLIVGLPLLGCNRSPEPNSNPPAEHAAARAVTATGVVAIRVGDDGFMPSRVTLKTGQKSTLRFTRTTDQTCATEVSFPELGIKKPLPLNQPVDVEVPTDAPRTLTFQCGMGMYKSSVVIG